VRVVAPGLLELDSLTHHLDHVDAGEQVIDEALGNLSGHAVRSPRRLRCDHPGSTAAATDPEKTSGHRMAAAWRPPETAQAWGPTSPVRINRAVRSACAHAGASWRDA